MTEKINIIIVDDHKLFRLGIKSMLADYEDIVVIGEASNGQELLNMLETLHANVVLLDIIMPGMSGVETVCELRQNHPDIKILMLSAENSREIINDLLETGINGFITKSACDGGNELAKAIRSVSAGSD